MQTELYVSEERLRIFTLLAGKPVRERRWVLTVVGGEVFLRVWFCLSSGVAVVRLPGQRLRPAGLETLRGRSSVVHAASDRLGGRRPGQIPSCLQGQTSDLHSVRGVWN